MRRIAIATAVAGGLFVLDVGCTAGSKFSCLDDTACRLAGTPGICTEAGQCAYPSSNCESGWEYPVGAPGALADECADGPPPTGTTTTSTTSSAATTLAPTTGPASTSVTTTTSSSGSGSTSSVAPTSAGSSGGSTGGLGTSGSTGTAMCIQDEPDTQETALESMGADCAFTVEGYLHGVGDTDWRRRLSDCTATAGQVSIPQNVDIACVSVSCPGADDTIQCTGADTIIDDDFQSCCSIAPHEATFEIDSSALIECDTLDDLYIQVTGSTNEACEPYTFGFVPNQ